MEVKIDGITYVPVTDFPLRMPSGRHPSDLCRVCGQVNYRVTDSRNKDGYRMRRKECLACGYKWKTIEYTVLPIGRPRENFKP